MPQDLIKEKPKSAKTPIGQGIGWDNPAGMARYEKLGLALVELSDGKEGARYLGAEPIQTPEPGLRNDYGLR